MIPHPNVLAILVGKVAGLALFYVVPWCLVRRWAWGRGLVLAWVLLTGLGMFTLSESTGVWCAVDANATAASGVLLAAVALLYFRRSWASWLVLAIALVIGYGLAVLVGTDALSCSLRSGAAGGAVLLLGLVLFAFDGGRARQ